MFRVKTFSFDSYMGMNTRCPRWLIDLKDRKALYINGLSLFYGSNPTKTKSPFILHSVAF
ncbi:hypothetical protein KL86DYS2_13451 [uncultured Dysgonomonas sp.]|uniref:Uncharacterized protein n=1 Tax=uncultured Dysgonomonas sp. TaxID=206096 RepID=A0A212KAS0_9BACT|nr:hypothetical protein KL86DYS2_13451 [uncultured Dysgonomonas sp.]